MVRPGEVDRDLVAARVVRVLSAGARGRSTWNDFDVRGVAEEVLARRNVVGDRAVLRELAEDITRRARVRCLSVVRKPVPAHVRHLTSREVLDLERDIQGRLAVRGAFDGTLAPLADVAQVVDDQGLDRGQVDGVRAIAGTDPVVLVEGAAGTGKSTMLAAANTLITQAGRRMMVVAPSRNAALIAAEKIGAADGPAAAGLAFAHGFRWDRDGVWTRLRPGEVCPLSGGRSWPR
ncbi:MAG TPA: AAA family ATPase [Nakamurella sp.]